MATPPVTGHPYLDTARTRPGSVLALAHRGGAYHPEVEGLENTMAAFRHAVELGYRYLETDVHVTRDGVLLAFHDAVLDRVTDRRGAVAEMTRAEVREARLVPVVDFKGLKARQAPADAGHEPAGDTHGADGGREE